MALPSAPSGKIAIAPLVGSQETEESLWLGALLSRLFGDHLSAAGLSVLDYNAVARQVLANKYDLPLSPEAIESLRTRLNLRALVHGSFVLDNDSKMLGLRLVVEGQGISPAPLEAGAPLAGYDRFIERVSLALVDQLNVRVDDTVRSRVRAVYRPARFDAIRQLAQAHAAWSKRQHELALAAVTSALSLDPDYEEASTIEVAVARAAGDTATARNAFRRWSEIALKKKRPRVAAERLVLLGHWLAERGEWGEARRAYEDARDLYQKEKDDLGAARAENNLANLDLLSGRTQNAIKAYRRSLRVFEEDVDAQPDVAITLANLALAHKDLGQRKEALEAIEQAIVLARQLNDTRLSARALAQRGALYDDMGSWGQAEEDYSTASRLLDVVSDEAGLAMVKSHQAILYRQQGSYERAEALLLESLRMTEKQPNPHERAAIWLNLADLYLSMHLYDQAWRYADQAHRVFSRLNSGLDEQAKGLLETLQRIPDPEPEPEPETDPPVIDDPFSAGSASSSSSGESFPPAGRTGQGTLFSDSSLYDSDDPDYDDSLSTDT